MFWFDNFLNRRIIFNLFKLIELKNISLRYEIKKIECFIFVEPQKNYSRSKIKFQLILSLFKFPNLSLLLLSLVLLLLLNNEYLVSSVLFSNISIIAVM